jgi:hypothetical protein
LFNESVPTAAHPDDRNEQNEQQHCRSSHPTDTEGPESVATAAHPDDRNEQNEQQHCRSSHPTDTEGPESVATAAHADDRHEQHTCRSPQSSFHGHGGSVALRTVIPSRQPCAAAIRISLLSALVIP